MKKLENIKHRPHFIEKVYNINIHLRSYLQYSEFLCPDLKGPPGASSYMKNLVPLNGNFYAKTAFNISKFGDNQGIMGIRKDDYEIH